MKIPRWSLVLLAALFVVQLAVPASMIWSRETTLKHGEAFKFRTGAVDPYDIFRGRYVVVRFEQRVAPWLDAREARRGARVFALVETGADGFATFTGATGERPEEGAYLEVRVQYQSRDDQVMLDVPFERFYMEESVAPAAEAAYLEHSRREQRDAHVILRIREGRGVIENLIVGGVPIRQLVDQS